MILFQDVVQQPDLQKRKEYFDEPSYVPGGSHILPHTAEVLRQVKGANVGQGGWVGGDAWFGSVATAVEVMKTFGVHSSWIIKNNHAFFPMPILHAVLKARYEGRPAGHWVVMSTTISDVKLFALAYAWSQTGVSYILSTCGTTDPCPIKYQTSFEDSYGITTSKDIDRPNVAHFLFEFLPLIDEHNKQRQSLLALEK